MIYYIILFFLTIESLFDLRYREVPDFMNYTLFYIALIYNLILSFYVDKIFLLYSFTGFILALLLSILLFYSGQWGGGDSKLLIAMGTLIGYNFNLFYNDFILFIILIFLCGAIYSVVYILGLTIYNYKKVNKDLIKVIKKDFKGQLLALLFFLFFELYLFLLDLNSWLITLLLILSILFYYFLFHLLFYIDQKILIKKIDVKYLTEGDWIVDDVYYNKKYICGPKDLGITKEQINLLKRYNIKKVKVKYGVPFIPSFLFAYIIILFF